MNGRRAGLAQRQEEFTVRRGRHLRDRQPVGGQQRHPVAVDHIGGGGLRQVGDQGLDRGMQFRLARPDFGIGQAAHQVVHPAGGNAVIQQQAHGVFGAGIGLAGQLDRDFAPDGLPGAPAAGREDGSRHRHRADQQPGQRTVQRPRPASCSIAATKVTLDWEHPISKHGGKVKLFGPDKYRFAWAEQRVSVNRAARWGCSRERDVRWRIDPGGCHGGLRRCGPSPVRPLSGWSDPEAPACPKPPC